MKICPNCQTRYTDDSLQFCLQDGTALVNDESRSSLPTVAFNDEQETVVRNRTSGEKQSATQNYPTQQQTANYENAPQKSNTALAIVVTVLAMLLIFAIGIAGWLYVRNKNEVAANQNSQNPVQNSAKPTVTPSAKPSAKPTATATPSFDVDEVKAEVAKSINGWRAAAESIDLDEYMTRYAPTVDYYNKKQISAGTVRADKEKAFSTYDSIRISLTNMNVTPDAGGENATALFDKEWRFEGAEKVSEGKVQTQLQLKRISGDWKITGERDLKVYYTK